MILLSNPIFKREFTTVSRSWKSRFLIGLYLGCLAFLLLLLWPSGGVQSVVTESARKIFSIFFSVNLLLLNLMIPAFTAGSITEERERSTYGALFTTLLTPMEIMSGKLFASITMILIMTVLSMPVASVCALAGGVDALFLGKVMLLLLASSISCGIIGLACSSLCRTTTGAVLLNYVVLLLLAGGTFLPSLMLSNLLPDLNGLFLTIRNLSAFDALLYLLYPETYRLTLNVDLSGGEGLSPFGVFLAGCIVESILALILFRCRIMKAELGSTRQKGNVYSDEKKALKRKLTFPFYLLDPLKRKKPIGRFSNPVFVAEMRSKLFSNPNFVIRCISTIFVLSLGILTLLSFQMGEDIHAGSVRAVAIVFQLGIVALLAPGISSGLITDEITRGTFDALRMTALHPLTVITGKFKATFYYALIFLISSIFILLALAYLEQSDCFPEQSVLDPEFWNTLVNKIRTESDYFSRFWNAYRPVALWVVILLLSTITFLSTGLFCSAYARNTPQATAAAYAITGVLCVVTLLPLLLAEKFSPSLAYFILSFNPVAAAMQATSDVLKNYPSLWISNVITLLILNFLFLSAAAFRVCHLFRNRN